MAHAGVDHLRPARRRTVAQAVGVGAQVRAALDHLAPDPELRLARVVALLEVATARVGRDAARRAGVVRVAAGPPVVGPLPDVAGHVVETEPVGREAADRRGAGVAALLGAAPREVGPVPGVGHDPAIRTGLVAPGERRTVEAAAGGVLPLGLGGQVEARPVGEGPGVLVGDVDDRVVGTALDRAAGPVRRAPARARRPGPPLAQVPQVDRAGGRGEHQRAGHQVRRRRAREVGGIHRALRDGDVARAADEPCEALVGHGHRLDREAVDRHPVGRRLLRVVGVGAHHEGASRQGDRGVEAGARHASREAFWSFSITRSRLKLAGFCRTGNAANVWSFSATKACAGTNRKMWSNIQSK